MSPAGHPSNADRWDVLVAGGGPAGSSVATMLVKRGYRVVVIEKDRHPRFHIGESLLPHTMQLLRTLGVYDTVAQAGFVPKWGARFVLANGDKLNTFYFADGLVRSEPGAFQVLRSRFDQMLLEHARKTGADVREGHTVRELTLDAESGGSGGPGGVTAVVRDENGGTYELRARFFADATGRDAFLATRSRTRQLDPALRHVALYAHFDGVQQDEGRDSGNTISIPIRGGWIWFIPLERGITSIGVVVDAQMFKRSAASQEEFFEHVLAQVPVISTRMAQARRVSIVHSTNDFSYTTPGLYGDRFIVLGDAGFFLDPIFSSGVHLAISSGIHGAEAIDDVLSSTSSREQRNSLRHYERRLRASQRLYFRFIHGWYSPGFLEVLLSPTRRFQLVEAIVSVLAGSAGGSWRVRARVELFFLIVWLNQRLRFLPAIDRSALPPQELTT